MVTVTQLSTELILQIMTQFWLFPLCQWISNFIHSVTTYRAYKYSNNQAKSQNQLTQSLLQRPKHHGLQSSQVMSICSQERSHCPIPRVGNKGLLKHIHDLLCIVNVCDHFSDCNGTELSNFMTSKTRNIYCLVLYSKNLPNPGSVSYYVLIIISL